MFNLEDLKNPQNLSKAVVRDSGDPLKTTGSQDAEPKLTLTTYSLSEAMQGVGLYKPAGYTYDVFNRELGNELQGLGQEALWTSRDDKLMPYDVFLDDVNPNTAGASGIGNSALSGSTSNGPSTSVIGGIVQGSVQDLCKQIVNHPNVSFDPGRAQDQFKTFADGGTVPLSGGKTEPDKNLLGIVLTVANAMKIRISSFIRPESPNSHGMGTCIDIWQIDGQATNGSDAAGNKMVEFVVNLIPDKGGFTIGFGRGLRQTPLPGGGAKATYDFNDNANHVHMQIDYGRNK